MLGIDYLTTYLATTVFCCMVVVIMAFKMNRNVGGFHEVRAFRQISVVSVFNILMNSLWALILFDPLAFPRPVVMAINACELVTTALVVYLWCLFVIRSMQREVDEQIFGRAVWAVLVAPVVMMIVADATSPWTGLTFVIDESNMYVRGQFFTLHYVPALIYFAMAVLANVRARRIVGSDNVTGRRRLARYLVLTILPLAGGILQLFFSGAPFSVIAITASMFTMFVLHQDERITTDALTGLNNRVRLEELLRRRIEAADTRPFTLFMADIDKFKRINDTFGHSVGDVALSEVAAAFRQLGAACQSLYVCRYGGDEFLFMVDASEGMAPDELDRRLAAALAKVHNKSLGFDISMSLGWTQVTDGSRTAAEVIADADERLYENKEKRALLG